MKQIMKIFIGFILFSALNAFAQDANIQQNLEKENEIAMKAKKKLYPSGPNESELKVQAILSAPKRKVAPTAPEAPAEESVESSEPVELNQ